MSSEPGRARVFLHVGVPKSGTSFLQATLRANADRLLADGVWYPTQQHRGLFHAALELTGNHPGWGVPQRRVDGNWAGLCARGTPPGRHLGLQQRATSATSRPVTCAAALARPRRARGAPRRHRPRPGPAAPAEWQEGVKHGRGLRFDRFLARVLDPARSHSHARKFWRHQDLADLLDRWGHHLSPDRVHVVTCPPPGAPRDAAVATVLLGHRRRPGGRDLPRGRRQHQPRRQRRRRAAPGQPADPRGRHAPAAAPHRQAGAGQRGAPRRRLRPGQHAGGAAASPARRSPTAGGAGSPRPATTSSATWTTSPRCRRAVGWPPTTGSPRAPRGTSRWTPSPCSPRRSPRSGRSCATSRPRRRGAGPSSPSRARVLARRGAASAPPVEAPRLTGLGGRRRQTHSSPARSGDRRPTRSTGRVELRPGTGTASPSP